VTAASPIRTGSTAGPAPPAWGVRRAPRRLLAGVALMVAFALLFALLALRADPARPVLALARPVPAGTTITEADLTVVRVVPDPGVQVIREADRDHVVGHTAAVPLVAGSLLSPKQVGAADWPPAGESVVGVPVSEARMPTGLSAGSRVSVLMPGPLDADGPATEQAPATAYVVSVAAPSAAGVSTVSLLLDALAARRVAGAGEVVLVLESPGSGG